MAKSLAEAWAQQIAWCEQAGSPFTARALDAAWADHARGGAPASLLPGWAGDPIADAVALRVAGALHALALSKRDAALAAVYAELDAARLPDAVPAALARHPGVVAEYLASAPQTNEIGRSAALLGGFATIARETGLPLATLEIGASAGLNLMWHRYRYELGPIAWGDATSPVQIRAEWQGAPPELPPRIAVASQSACDLAPVDLRRDGAALRLLSYVWADQGERLARLRAATTLAQASGLHVEASDALPWVQRALARPRPGVATLLYHSVMWHYMPAPTRDALRDAIETAGARATMQAPLAWLAFESPTADVQMQLQLTLWPGGERRVLADAHPHGRWVRWRA